jgi:hypothetical protein
MDVLSDLLDRVRLKGTLLFNYELSRPWSTAPRFPDAVFHYLGRGSAILVTDRGQPLRMAKGDFVLISRGEPQVLCSDRRTRPRLMLDLDRRPAHLGVALWRTRTSARPLG